MNIIWLGHGSFRIEIGDQVLLVDPWLEGNPMLAEEDHGAAIGGATHILATHGHFDHASDIAAVSGRTGAPVSAPHELGRLLFARGAAEGHAFGRGGTIGLGGVTATLVPASHSSSIGEGDAARYAGQECGYVLRGEGRTIYFSGDTGIMADMDWIGDYHRPDIGILSAGGHFTMDMAGAAYAARRYFRFDMVIPCHYRTFPLLEQSADALRDGLPGVKVVEPEVMKPITP